MHDCVNMLRCNAPLSLYRNLATLTKAIYPLMDPLLSLVFEARFLMLFFTIAILSIYVHLTISMTLKSVILLIMAHL